MRFCHKQQEAGYMQDTVHKFSKLHKYHYLFARVSFTVLLGIMQF